MNRKQKKVLYRIIISAVLLIVAFLLDRFLLKDKSLWLTLAVYLIPYLVIGYDVLKKAALNVLHGQVFDENFLMAIATVGAVCIGFFPDAEPQYTEAVFVMLFYQTGELFQSIAVGKSRRSIAALMDIRPDVALLNRDGQLIETDPEEIAVGDVITVRVGDRVPLDGTVVSGESSLDTSALTGESIPRSIGIGDSVISGCINLSGVLTVKVDRPFHESTVSRILELVENSSANKSRSENFITRFARIYTPLVVLAAVVLAFLPPLFVNYGYLSALPDWILRALTFLVVSCPCALVISVPLSFFGGIGGASKKGVLIKGSNYLEALSLIDTVVFDKTGTLTKGCFKVAEIHSMNLTEDELLKLSAHAEFHSTHPIAIALKTAFDGDLNSDIIGDIKEIAGQGIMAEVDRQTVACGNEKLMSSLSLVCSQYNGFGTAVHVAVNGQYCGYIVISDEIKSTSKEAVSALKKCGVSTTVMLTGDRKEAAEKVSAELDLDQCFAELLPQDKVKQVEHLLSKAKNGRRLAFIGDGINDAPVLTRADVGIAMGGLGSDAAIEAADIVLMDDDPMKIVTAMSLAKRTLKIVRQNIWFALGVKGAVLLLSVFGFAPMWLAIFADVGVAVIAILNAMRTLK
ncbi:MAG: cadmium-translocating P-type ATPase [Clostridia bacterium]|nr:cadmium-translocating P-type ATPase [Clostridia bacterium]